VYDITNGALPCGGSINDAYRTCNDNSCGNNATVSFATVQGAEYLLRMGVAPDTSGGTANFTITYPETRDVEFEPNGAGLLANQSSPLIRNTLFLANASRNFGGGVEITRGSPVFEGCIFAENVASRGAGVGLTNTERARFERCSFEQNKAVEVVPNDVSGGGLFATSTLPTERSLEVRTCAFIGNEAYDRGAGLYAIQYGTGQFLVNVEGTRFVSNRITRDSGCDDEPGGADNRRGAGGGIFTAAPMSITNSSFWANEACRDGGAIFTRRPVSVINSTIVGNRSIKGDNGAGISSWKGGASASVENTIVWNNMLGTDDPSSTPSPDDEQPPEWVQFGSDGTGGLFLFINTERYSVRNSCFNLPSVLRGNGNIGNDPELVEESLGDFQLRPTSPCIDRGNNFVETQPQLPGVQLLPDFDIFGRTRILDGNGDGIETVDMGAFEAPAVE
jgi:hypothetical protein